MNPTADEQQKAVSTVLNQMRKKNLSGMLAAQRNGTLDEFLAPHLAEYWEKQRAKEAGRRASERPGSTPFTAAPAASSAAQRPVTMGRPVAAPAAPSQGSADVNPRGIQILRVVSLDIRAESISSVKKDGLNAHCAYVVTDPLEKEVYCWVGKNCSAGDEAFAATLARDLASHDLRSTRPVLTLKQLSGTVAIEHLQALTEIIFWQIITGVNPVSVSAELKQKCSLAAAPKNAALVALEYNTGGGGQYVPIGDASVERDGKVSIKREILKPTRVVVVECGVNSYLWVGPEVAAAAVTSALDVLRRRISSQSGRVLCQVRNTNEPTVFTRLFAAENASVAATAAPAEDKAAARSVPEHPAEPTNQNSGGAESTDSTAERPLSVSERMKRFSTPSNAATAGASSTASKPPAASEALTAPTQEVDPATLSVKEKMAMFRKEKSTSQVTTKKQPIDIGVDVGMKEKKALMESTLDPTKIRLNVVDGTGQARRSSFTIEDVPDSENPEGGSASVTQAAAASLAEDVKETPITEVVASEPPAAANASGESADSTSDNTVVAGPPHTHKKHVPKFEPEPISSPVVPIARKSITESEETKRDATLANPNENPASTSMKSEPPNQHEDTAPTSDSTPDNTVVAGPPHTHKKHVPKFEPEPISSPVVPIARKSITESEETKKDTETATVITAAEPRQQEQNKEVTPSSPVHSPLNSKEPEQKDPVITTEYKVMEETEGKSSAGASPAEEGNGCCTIM